MRIIQALGEAVIPILGFFYFEWSLYFILLFYFIDLLATEVFLLLKVKRILKFKSIKKVPPRLKLFAFLNFSLIIGIITGVHVIMTYLYPGISFKKEFVNFLMYEEAGIPIPQGFILLPLVVFGNYQQYKTMFLMPKLFQFQNWKELFYSRQRALIISIVGIILGTLLSVYTPLPILVYLLAIVFIKFWIDYRLTV